MRKTLEDLDKLLNAKIPQNVAQLVLEADLNRDNQNSENEFQRMQLESQESEILLLDEDEMKQRITSNYTQKQKQLGEILQIILANPTADTLEENLQKIKNLIDVSSNSLEFTIKIINRTELMDMKSKQPVVKIN